jgi:hypothetical protein
LERDEDNSYLTLDGLDEDPMQSIHSHSVTYRIAMGPQQGRKVFTLQTIPLKPRVNLIRFHGVFAPNGKHRALITPTGRGKGSKQANKEGDDRSFTERHIAMTGAQRLKRVFNIDIETCEKCKRACAHHCLH